MIVNRGRDIVITVQWTLFSTVSPYEFGNDFVAYMFIHVLVYGSLPVNLNINTLE